MSYCRWSSDAYRCDVYAYHTDTGYEVHLAAKKRVYDEPPPDDPPYAADAEDWIEWHLHVQNEWLPKTRLEPIGLSRDGQYFSGLDIDDFLDLMKSLRDEGYRMPDGTIEAIEQERREMS